MTHRLNIRLRLAWLNGRGLANFIGDHTVAEGWRKYLMRRQEVAQCEIVGPLPTSCSYAGDIEIHFQPNLQRNPHTRTVLYCQNSWPREMIDGGTVGMCISQLHRYDGFIFVSEKLQDAVLKEARAKGLFVPPSAVIPFGYDPEIFFPQFEERYHHKIAFVGNDIRGDEANEKYLTPWLNKGLVIYGGPFRDLKFQKAHMGRLTQDGLRGVYSSADKVLNFVVPIANEYDIVPMRIFEAGACGATIANGRIVSDVQWPDQGEGNTWADRVATLMGYLT